MERYLCMMARKKWQRQSNESGGLTAARIKRRWQIALRRYVLEGNPAAYYAPFFALDTKNLREWFSSQFPKTVTWDDFGLKWQFEHIVALNYFDMSDEADLRLCWNFTNLRIELLSVDESPNRPLDLASARRYFEDLIKKCPYTFLQGMINRIDSLQGFNPLQTSAQIDFLSKNFEHIEIVRGFTSFEFEQLNAGRSSMDIQKQDEWLKRYTS